MRVRFPLQLHAITACYQIGLLSKCYTLSLTMQRGRRADRDGGKPVARGMSPMRQRFSNLTRRISGVSAGGGSGGSGGGGGRLVLGDPMFRALYESLLKLEVFVTSLKDRCVAA